MADAQPAASVLGEHRRFWVAEHHLARDWADSSLPQFTTAR